MAQKSKVAKSTNIIVRIIITIEPEVDEERVMSDCLKVIYCGENSWFSAKSQAIFNFFLNFEFLVWILAMGLNENEVIEMKPSL